LHKYPHIFFDLDHTLWDFDANSRTALESLYTDFIKSRAAKLTFKEFYYSYKDVNDRWWQQYRVGKVDKAALRTGRFRDTLHRFGILDEGLTEDLAREYVARSPYQTKLFPGAIEVLDWLQAKGHTMSIITNGFEEIQHIKIKESGMERHFTHIITSEQVDARKPDERIFNHAFELSGADPSQSLMIGDNLEADIKGASKAGMDQVYFNPEGKKHLHYPTFEIKSLLELRNII
jgi:putative hydrolase of the HAD superfamily